MMTIRVSDLDTLIEVVERLVRKGLTFEISEEGSKFVITLLGGF